MSEKINDGGSAFPHAVPIGAWGDPSQGMTLHAYYAGKALQGFCANPAVFAENSRSGWGLVNSTEEELAHYCNSIADAMIKAAS